MREADLTGVNLTGAALRDVDLSGTQWPRSTLDRCDLRGSDLSSLDPLTVSLAGAVIDLAQAAAIASALGLDVRADELPSGQ
jgi:uncharacterized protein YjbI with pentapeptide repeats